MQAEITLRRALGTLDAELDQFLGVLGRGIELLLGGGSINAVGRRGASSGTMGG